MQAYKLKGIIDSTGNLVINEPVKIPPTEIKISTLSPPF
jgi:hypothetical protein